MGKYMFRSTYTQAGLPVCSRKAARGDGEALTQTIEGMGGSVESLYYAFGDPGPLYNCRPSRRRNGRGRVLVIGNAGALDISVTVLVTPETIERPSAKAYPTGPRVPDTPPPARAVCREGSVENCSAELLFALLYNPLLVSALLILTAVAAQGEEWPYYAADAKSSKYAPLSQIDGTNFAQLQEVWRYTVPDKRIAERQYMWTGTNKGTPLMVDGVLYYGSPFNILSAVDPTSGEELWTFDPKVWENYEGFTGILRGIAYWQSGNKKRIFYATSTAPPLFNRHRDRPARPRVWRGWLRRFKQGAAPSH